MLLTQLEMHLVYVVLLVDIKQKIIILLVLAFGNATFVKEDAILFLVDKRKKFI
jgi:hypothetical protein